jgi:mRNA-degrading endonuclease RelE of RelBE toxin-antitoxin system
MASFRIVIQREAEKELRKLPPPEIRRVLKAIAGLGSDVYRSSRQPNGPS